MSGSQKVLQVGWLGITVALVALHVANQHPFDNAKDAATLLGLLALSIRALMGVWRWSDLAWRKLWLWALNSSVNWTLEVRVAVPTSVEEADIAVLANSLRDSLKSDKVSRPPGRDAITIETASRYTLTVRPVQAASDAHWSIRFNPVHIGYRDASRVLQRVFIPIIEQVAGHIESAGERQYAIEARFSRVNPYAAVMLNELRAKSADKVLLSFKQDGNTVQLTKNAIISSSSTQANAIDAMSAVFGLSLRGAFSAGNV